MEYRTMPCLGEKVSEIGLGLAKIHQAEKKDMVRIMERAMENGVNYFDLCGHTLDVYRAFAEAAKNNRKQLFTQMHFGAVYDQDGVYGRKRNLDVVRSSFERVLEASGTDYTDFGMIHCIDEDEEFDADILLCYDPALPPRAVLQYAEKLTASGKTVLVQPDDTDMVRCRERIFLSKEGM